jgi:hypothetical protein
MVRPGRNLSVAGFGVASVWMNMGFSDHIRVQGPADPEYLGFLPDEVNRPSRHPPPQVWEV